eukprot:CAMPEP_0119554244 /NCGR_PEP_ID=MMETSP1352-20130426/6795_1 /TAXON_ID=265584 /ORGANISM="Stauroneis constricta, Strain CCMP1120" /LENGTH=535 /DNA_ID=CAMNT_0007600809 /DNA_START=215 /DNA_END=1818 /DNA_ORIENTATION=+
MATPAEPENVVVSAIDAASNQAPAIDASVPTSEAAAAATSPAKEGPGVTVTDCCACCSPFQRCCNFFHFDGHLPAKGLGQLAIGRGAVVMSNIFLTSSFLYLANDDANCLDEKDEYIDDCGNKVYGFSPAALMANTVVISGLLSAFFMPVIGALVDFTPSRKAIGIASCVAIGVIQAAQIGTVAATWFPMLILQAIAGFLYQILIVAVYAYMPEVWTAVGHDRMTDYSSRFTAIQFGAQAMYLVLIIAISQVVGMSDVVTGQASQAINTVWIAFFFYRGWKLMPFAPPTHTLPEGHSLLAEGFRQNWETAKSINRDYRAGLRWFFLALIFAEASAAAITSVAVIFLDEVLGMGSAEIGIFFFVTLVSTIPGTQLGAYVTSRTNPNTSWQMSMMSLLAVLVVGALTLVSEDQIYFSYVWGIFVGLSLGWFYPTENLFFSSILPKGQDTELSGFFVYCTQILGWLPPLFFSIIVEAGYEQKWGVIIVSFGFLVATVLLRFAGSWEVILEESGRTRGEDSNNATGHVHGSTEIMSHKG